MASAERKSSPAPQTALDAQTALEIERLSGQTDADSIERLLAYLADDDPSARGQACQALAESAAQLRLRARGGSIAEGVSSRFAFTDLLARMHANLVSGAPALRAATADCLALFDHEAAVGFLGEAARDPHPLVRVSVATALGRIGDEAGIGWLVADLADPSLWVRRAAADALGSLAAPQAVDGLESALGDSQPLVRAAVVTALGHMQTARARRLLERCTRDADLNIRWYAARGLGLNGDRASCAVLSELRRQPGVTLFGQSTAQVVRAAIIAIEERDHGVISRLRRALRMLFQALRRLFRRRSRRRGPA